MTFVVNDLIIDLQCDLTRVTNWVDVQNVKDDTYQRALRTSSWKVFWIRAEVPEAQDHFSLLKVTQYQSQEPLWNFQSLQYSYYNIVIYFVKRLGPVCQKIVDSSWLVGVICAAEDEVDYGDESMRTGSNRNCKDRNFW